MLQGVLQTPAAESPATAKDISVTMTPASPRESAAH